MRWFLLSMTICLKSLFESNDQLTDTPAKLLVSLDFSRIIRMFFWFLFSQYSNLYDDDDPTSDEEAVMAEGRVLAARPPHPCTFYFFRVCFGYVWKILFMKLLLLLHYIVTFCLLLLLLFENNIYDNLLLYAFQQSWRLNTTYNILNLPSCFISSLIAGGDRIQGPQGT